MILACIVVNLCTLIGLLTLVPGIKGVMENTETRDAWLSGSSSFAAGALLAATGFLMIPECTPAFNAMMLCRTILPGPSPVPILDRRSPMADNALPTCA